MSPIAGNTIPKLSESTFLAAINCFIATFDGCSLDQDFALITCNLPPQLRVPWVTGFCQVGSRYVTLLENSYVADDFHDEVIFTLYTPATAFEELA